MHIIQIVTYAFSLLSLILSINAASNLVKNPGFDEAHSDCNSSPSWSQYSSSNLFSVCPQTDYYMVSKPNAMYLNSPEGWAGAVQTIDVSQTVVTSFNFSCMVWLISCSQQSCYTTIGWFGTSFLLTYSDGTTDTFENAFPHGYSTSKFVPYSFTFTPAKPVRTLVVNLLMEGNGIAIAMWDDISLVTLSAPSTDAPTVLPTVLPTALPTATPTEAPTNLPPTPSTTNAPSTSAPTPSSTFPTSTPTNTPSASEPTSSPSTLPSPSPSSFPTGTPDDANPPSTTSTPSSPSSATPLLLFSPFFIIVTTLAIMYL